MLESQIQDEAAKQFVGDDGLPLSFERDNPFSFEQDAFVRTDYVSGAVLLSKELTLESPVGASLGHQLMPLVDGAIAATLRQLDRQPDNPRVLINAAMVHLNAELFDEAESLFRRAQEVAPSDTAGYAGLAKLYGLQGRVDEAIREYEKLLRMCPEDATAMMNLAQLCIQARQLKRADTLLEGVLRSDPGNVAAYNGRGILRILRDDVSGAVLEFRRALAADGRHAGIYSNLGVCYAFLGSHKKAERAFATALKLEPQNASAIKASAEYFLRRSRPEKAIELLAPYVRREEDDLRARVLLAKAYYLAKRLPETAEQLVPALRRAEEQGDHRELAGILNNLGVVASAKGNTDKALELYQQALKVDERQQIALHNSASLLIENGRSVEARKVLDQCLRFYPGDAKALALVACCHNLREEYGEAWVVLERAMAADPYESGIFGPLTVILGEVEGDFRECVEHLRRGLKHHPRDLLIINNLAYAYLMVDEVITARQLLDSIAQWPKVTDGSNARCLTATRGLLLLKEGSELEARRLYNLAAGGARTLAQRLDVFRKRDLELARAALEAGERKRAIRLLQASMRPGDTEAPFLSRQSAALLASVEA